MYLCKLFTLTTFIFLSLTAFGSQTLTIDSFEYSQNQVAQNTWKPQNECFPVGITSYIKKQGEHAMLLRCDFSNINDRCYWDREVELNLNKFGRFSLWFYVKEPLAFQNGTLYFQSGDGWFAAGFLIEKEGWNQVSLWKSDFKIEDSPTGWSEIERIRLSFWKAKDTDTVIIVDNIEAIADEIVVVLGNLTLKKNSPAANTVRNFCDSMTNLLEDLNLDFGVVTDTDVESGALSGCKLAIFPYNPDISEKECKAVEKFVKSDGKFMLFYSLPENLAELLGIEIAGWMQEEYIGQFSSIKLKTDIIDGMPEDIVQGSWNVRIPKPKYSETKVVGEWIDTEGRNTEIPAITVNPNGMFMGHVLLPNDSLNKKQMLFALFGKLLPDMHSTLSRAVLRNIGEIAGFESFEKSTEFIKENVTKISDIRRKVTLNHLAKSKKILIQAKQKKQYGETLKLSRQAMQELREALFYSFPSKKGEFRALWCHSAFGIPGWSWDNSIKWIKENGFNAIVPNMLWGGLAYYPSDVLPTAEEVGEKGDQIEKCLQVCKKYGIKMHVWKVNWNLSRAPEDFVSRLRRQKRLQKDRWEREINWLCPSHPENFKLELESMLEIVRKYDVDGIHFDYIRYPHGNACYCSDCQKRFEDNTDITVNNWPEDVISGDYAKQFAQWRRQQITRLVKAVSEKAREIEPNIEVSAAVFRDYPRCIQTVGQDWKSWIEAGYLDFVCPMNYTDNNHHFKNLVSNQLKVVGGSIPVYPGIGASAPGLPPEQVAMQIHIARNLGVDGFIIFNYDISTARDVLPALRKGINISDN